MGVGEGDRRVRRLKRAMLPATLSAEQGITTLPERCRRVEYTRATNPYNPLWRTGFLLFGSPVRSPALTERPDPIA